jgi:hypothetical protein
MPENGSSQLATLIPTCPAARHADLAAHHTELRVPRVLRHRSRAPSPDHEDDEANDGHELHSRAGMKWQISGTLPLGSVCSAFAPLAGWP